MDTENNPQAGFSTIEEAVTALRESRKPAEEQPEPETATEEPEPESEEITDEELQADEVEEEIDEEAAADGEEASEEEEDDAEQEDEEDDALYEVEGETFTLSELQEWKKNGLRQADYTRKTQEISRDREALVKDRDAFDAEREQVHQTLQQQQAKLQDALAVFAIEQLEPPKRANFPDVDSYVKAQEEYTEASERKTQAQQAYQALQAEQMQATRQREAQRAMQYFPDWATDEGFNSAVKRMSEVASEFGFSAEEIVQGGLSDHRTFRVLNELAQLRELVGDREARRKASAKKVTKATKRLAPGAKPTKTRTQLEARKARQALRKTGSIHDAVKALRASRKG